MVRAVFAIMCKHSTVKWVFIIDIVRLLSVEVLAEKAYSCPRLKEYGDQKDKFANKNRNSKIWDCL